MELFDGDCAKIDAMNDMIAKDFGFGEIFDVCGQTYPRKFDARILNVLSSIAQTAYKFAGDVRLLQHDKQLEEPFEESQIGSSAMAYKRNPMRSERVCSLARYLMTDTLNASFTAGTQWLERTLDDSAGRRISIPEGFLCCDAILRLLANITAGLKVNVKMVEKTLRDYMPFIATENILMEAVKRGGDRQKLHEIIRKHSMAATARLKNGESFDLIGDLAAEPELKISRSEIEGILDPARYTGRAAEQTAKYVKKVRETVLAGYDGSGDGAEISL